MISTTLSAKLATAIVNADEMLSSDGYAFDRTALETVVRDAEVADLIQSLGALAPAKRRRS